MKRQNVGYSNIYLSSADFVCFAVAPGCATHVIVPTHVPTILYKCVEHPLACFGATPFPLITCQPRPGAFYPIISRGGRLPYICGRRGVYRIYLGGGNVYSGWGVYKFYCGILVHTVVLADLRRGVLNVEQARPAVSSHHAARSSKPIENYERSTHVRAVANRMIECGGLHGADLTVYLFCTRYTPYSAVLLCLMYCIHTLLCDVHPVKENNQLTSCLDRASHVDSLGSCLDPSWILLFGACKSNPSAKPLNRPRVTSSASTVPPYRQSVLARGAFRHPRMSCAHPTS